MKNEIVTIELFADDLTEAGIQKFKDKEVWNDNWDIMPIVVMDFEVETPLVKKHQGATRDNNLCPFCKDPVLASLFTNRRALDEWTISGLCAKCQDEVFGKEI